jgi:hypothetical protein
MKLSDHKIRTTGSDLDVFQFIEIYFRNTIKHRNSKLDWSEPMTLIAEIATSDKINSGTTKKLLEWMKQAKSHEGQTEWRFEKLEEATDTLTAALTKIDQQVQELKEVDGKQ